MRYLDGAVLAVSEQNLPDHCGGAGNLGVGDEDVLPPADAVALVGSPPPSG